MFQFPGQVTLFAPNFAPLDWLPCDGREVPSFQFQDLFEAIGTAFGGEGYGFNLPKLPPLGQAQYLICTRTTYDTQAVIGQVMLYAGRNAPSGWLPCDGRTLPIRDNQEFYAVTGTSFGGDGRTNFTVPKLSAPAHLQYIIANTGLYPSPA